MAYRIRVLGVLQRPFWVCIEGVFRGGLGAYYGNITVLVYEVLSEGFGGFGLIWCSARD